MSKRDGRKEVLFVCIGNACRSPMAEAIARLDAPDAIDAFSAGLMPIGYVPELTKQTLMKNGYWMEGLESKGISPGVWERVDVIVNLSRRPKEEAFNECSRVIDWDVADPFERDPEDYQQAFDKIRARVQALAEEFRREYAANRVAERRSRPRLYAAASICISLNGWNDARVVDISEDGLSLSSEMVLPSRPLQNLRIQFIGPPKGLEAHCQIAWKSWNNKQAGIQFVDLTEEARQFIRNWISEQASYIGFHIQIDRSRDGQNLSLEIPSGSLPGIEARGEHAAPEITQEAIIPAPATSRTSGSDSGSAILLRRGGRAARGFEIGLLPWTILSGLTKLGPSRRLWGESAGVVILTAVFTLALHSVATHRDVRSDVRIEAPTETSTPNQAKLKVHTRPSPTIPPSSVADPAAATRREAQSPVVETPPVKKVHEIQRDVQHDASTASPSRTATPAAEKSSRGVSVKTANRDSEKRSPRKQPAKPAPSVATDANISSVRGNRPETVANALPVPPPLEIKLPETANLAADRSAEVHPAETETKASSAPLAKRPVTTAQMTGEVSVVADPYPSLPANAGRSKKGKQGAASLQLGHLLSRVVPVYPEEARRQGIQGTVKFHAVVNQYGSVKSMQPVSGPPILAAAVMNAVRRWQYTETTLGGQPVETEVDATVVFTLSSPATPKS